MRYYIPYFDPGLTGVAEASELAFISPADFEHALKQGALGELAEYSVLVPIEQGAPVPRFARTVDEHGDELATPVLFN